MLSAEQLSNRANLSSLLTKIINRDYEFDISSLSRCSLGYYRHFYLEDSYFPIFDPEEIDQLFGISEEIANDLFCLHVRKYTGDRSRDGDARYHLARLQYYFNKGTLPKEGEL